MRNRNKIKMVLQSPSERNSVVWIDQAVAWAAARGILRDTHYVVVLIGRRGTARFDHQGGGIVTWNQQDQYHKQERDHFGPNTVVCIN